MEFLEERERTNEEQLYEHDFIHTRTNERYPLTKNPSANFDVFNREMRKGSFECESVWNFSKREKEQTRNKHGYDMFILLYEHDFIHTRTNQRYPLTKKILPRTLMCSIERREKNILSVKVCGISDISKREKEQRTNKEQNMDMMNFGFLMIKITSILDIV